MSSLSQPLLWDPSNLLVTIAVEIEGQIVSNPNALHFATVPWPLMQVRCIDRSRIATPPSLASYDPTLQQAVSAAFSSMRDIANQRIASYGELAAPSLRDDIPPATLLGAVQGLLQHAATAAAAMQAIAAIVPSVLAAIQAGGSVALLAGELVDELNQLIDSADTLTQQVTAQQTLAQQQQQAMSANGADLEAAALKAFEEAEKVFDVLKAARSILKALNEDLSELDGADCLGEAFEIVADIGEVIGAFLAGNRIPAGNASRSAREAYLEAKIQQQQAAVAQYKAELAALDAVQVALQHAYLATADACAAIPGELDAIATLAQHLADHAGSLTTLRDAIQSQAADPSQYAGLTELLQALAQLAPPHGQTWQQVGTSARVSLLNAFAQVTYGD